MTKISLLAAAVIGLGAAVASPAFAAEGNGNPFPNTAAYSSTRLPHQVARDVGQNQFPSVIGRPGTNRARLGNDQVLPATGNEQPVQTANSLPNGFAEGTVAFAQAKSMQDWMVAHSLAAPRALAAR